MERIEKTSTTYEKVQQMFVEWKQRLVFVKIFHNTIPGWLTWDTNAMFHEF